MAKAKTHYDSSFKKKAVELSYARGSVKEIANELDIIESVLYRWRREYERYNKNSFPGRGKPKLTDAEKELAKIKAELRDVTMERDILKKAVSIFSKSDKKSTGL